MSAHERFPSRCDPIPVCRPCPHPPFEQNQSGPDVPETVCWIPTGCCLPSPCGIEEWDFLCAIRALLPEGDTFNNTQAWAKDPPVNVGVIFVGCARVGCEQLILGSCCSDKILCDDDPVAPQLAVVDAYAAAAYRVIMAMCVMLREMDPCTSVILRRRWAERLGFDPKWSDSTIAQLLCIWPTLKRRVWNWYTLHEVAARFGASLTVRQAGDFSECQPSGWWTMARDRNYCPPLEACPPSAKPILVPITRLENDCSDSPPSINIITCPSDIVIPDDCTPQGGQVLPHDPELYAVFKELLPSFLGPTQAYFCFYDCNPADCIQ